MGTDRRIGSDGVAVADQKDFFVADLDAQASIGSQFTQRRHFFHDRPLRYQLRRSDNADRRKKCRSHRHCEFRTRLRRILMDETGYICRPHRHGAGGPGQSTSSNGAAVSAPDRQSLGASAKPDHVDGRDKPGHDGKWHGNHDLTSLFRVSRSSLRSSLWRSREARQKEAHRAFQCLQRAKLHGQTRDRRRSTRTRCADRPAV